MPVDNGNDGVFVINSADGSQPIVKCNNIEYSPDDTVGNSYKFKILRITKDITCNIN